MGSKNSIEQVQNFLNETITSIVSDTVVKKNNTIQQQFTQIQLLEYIDITQPLYPCPAGTKGGNISIGNVQESNFGVGISLEMIDSSELTQKIVSGIETAAASKVETKQDGMLAFTKDTDVNQRMNISSVTLTSIKSTIDMKLDSYVSQLFSRHRGVVVSLFLVVVGDRRENSCGLPGDVRQSNHTARQGGAAMRWRRVHHPTVVDVRGGH
jgi:hypothetical protein